MKCAFCGEVITHDGAMNRFYEEDGTMGPAYPLHDDCLWKKVEEDGLNLAEGMFCCQDSFDLKNPLCTCEICMMCRQETK